MDQATLEQLETPLRQFAMEQLGDNSEDMAIGVTYSILNDIANSTNGDDIAREIGQILSSDLTNIARRQRLTTLVRNRASYLPAEYELGARTQRNTLLWEDVLDARRESVVPRSEQEWAELVSAVEASADPELINAYNSYYASVNNWFDVRDTNPDDATHTANDQRIADANDALGRTLFGYYQNKSNTLALARENSLEELDRLSVPSLFTSQADYDAFRGETALIRAYTDFAEANERDRAKLSAGISKAKNKFLDSCISLHAKTGTVMAGFTQHIRQAITAASSTTQLALEGAGNLATSPAIGQAIRYPFALGGTALGQGTKAGSAWAAKVVKAVPGQYQRLEHSLFSAAIITRLELAEATRKTVTGMGQALALTARGTMAIGRTLNEHKYITAFGMASGFALRSTLATAGITTAAVGLPVALVLGGVSGIIGGAIRYEYNAIKQANPQLGARAASFRAIRKGLAALGTGQHWRELAQGFAAIPAAYRYAVQEADLARNYPNHPVHKRGFAGRNAALVGNMFRYMNVLNPRGTALATSVVSGMLGGVIGAAIQPALQPYLEAATNGASELAQQAGNTGSQLLYDAGTGLTQAGNSIGTAASSAISDMTQFSNESLAAAKMAAGAALHTMQDAGQSVLDAGSGAYHSAVSAASEKLTAIGEFANSTAQGAGDGLKAAGNAAGNLASSTIEGAKNLGGQAVAAVEGAGKAVYDFAADGIAKVQAIDFNPYDSMPEETIIPGPLKPEDYAAAPAPLASAPEAIDFDNFDPATLTPEQLNAIEPGNSSFPTPADHVVNELATAQPGRLDMVMAATTDKGRVLAFVADNPQVAKLQDYLGTLKQRGFDVASIQKLLDSGLKGNAHDLVSAIEMTGQGGVIKPGARGIFDAAGHRMPIEDRLGDASVTRALLREFHDTMKAEGVSFKNQRLLNMVGNHLGGRDAFGTEFGAAKAAPATSPAMRNLLNELTQK